MDGQPGEGRAEQGASATSGPATREDLADGSATAAPPERGGRLRRWGVGVLVVLSCLLLLLATVGVWGRNQVFDTDNFERIVGPLAEEREVQRELASYLTDQLSKAIDPERVIADALPSRASILAPTLAGAVEDFVRGKVLDFLQSDSFQTLWREITRRAHERAILVLEDRAPNLTADNGKVTINLVPVINQVVAAINESTPAIFGHEINVPEIDPSKPPSEAIQTLSSALGVELPKDFGQVIVYDDGKLAQTQQIVRIVQRAVVVLVILALLLPAAAILLSRRRRRTALQYAIGAAVTMVVLRRLVYVLERMVLDRVQVPARRPVVENTVDRLMHNLLLGAAWMLVIALVAALVLAMTGPYAWARQTRSRSASVARSAWRAVGQAGVGAEEDSFAGETTAWVHRHRSALQIGGAVIAGLVLLLADVSWLGLLVILVLLLVYEVVVTRWGTSRSEGTPPTPPASEAASGTT